MKAPKREEIGDEAFKVWCSTLVLSEKDAADARRLDRLSGMRIDGAPVNLSVMRTTSVGGVAIDPEPKCDAICRRCDQPMKLYLYLVDFLAAQRAKLPNCDSCMAVSRQESLTP